MDREELIKRLEELDASDDYHDGQNLDARSYWAAIDRAVKIVSGELIDWTSKPKHEARKPHPDTMAGRK